MLFSGPQVHCGTWYVCMTCGKLNLSKNKSMIPCSRPCVNFLYENDGKISQVMEWEIMFVYQVMNVKVEVQNVKFVVVILLLDNEVDDTFISFVRLHGPKTE